MTEETALTYTGAFGPEWIAGKVESFDNYFLVHLVDPKIPSEKSEFALEKKFNCEPKVGDRIKLRVSAPSNAYLLGVMINDVVVWNRFDQEDQEIKDKRKAEHEENLKARFERIQKQLDHDVFVLPAQFQRKIQRLRDNNPDFRWRYEEFEVFCMREAIKIISKLQTIDLIQKFIETKDVNVLKKMVPNLKWKQYFGNALAVASSYAFFYSTNPRLFHLSHGAMADVYGCKNYGCLPATEAEIAEAGK